MTSQPHLPTSIMLEGVLEGGKKTEMVDDSSCEELMLRSDSVSWPQGRTRDLNKGSYGAVYPSQALCAEPRFAFALGA